jgi:RimJ/RimL family protein N-acetyltransferase
MSFPQVRIETDRLVVREFGPADEDAVAVAIEAAEWDALPPGAPRAPGGVRRWLHESVQRFRKGGQGVHLAIEEAASGRHLGAMTLFNADWRRRQVEVGYGVRPAVRCRGYVTEGLAAVADWVLTDGGMRRIELRTERTNVPSVRVAEKTGFVCEATVLDPGTGRELLLFSRDA